MKVGMVLKYRAVDRGMCKIERGLRDNQNKKAANELHENMKNAQARSVKLEENAGKLLKEIEKVKGQVKIQEDKMQEFMSKDLENMPKADIEKLKALKDKLNQNLVILEKNLTALAENMNAILADFNKTIKSFNSAKEEFAKRKQAYDEDVKAVETQKQELAAKLDELSKSIETKIMEAYRKRRGENVFPVLVPLNNGNSCGGCHMELPFANLTKLNEDGIITCEHCRRIVYKNQN